MPFLWQWLRYETLEDKAQAIEWYVQVSCRVEIIYSKGFHKGCALTSYEDNFACLVWPSRESCLIKKFTSKTFAHLRKPFALLLKTVKKPQSVLLHVSAPYMYYSIWSSPLAYWAIKLWGVTNHCTISFFKVYAACICGPYWSISAVKTWWIIWQWTRQVTSIPISLWGMNASPNLWFTMPIIDWEVTE